MNSFIEFILNVLRDFFLDTSRNGSLSNAPKKVIYIYLGVLIVFIVSGILYFNLILNK